MVWTNHLGKRFAQRTLPWRELPPWLRMFRVVAITGWCVVILSLLIVGEIETAALRQPERATGIYVHPHNIKGVIRYFSDGQQRIYRVAHPLMIGSFAVAFITFCVYGRIEERWSEERRRTALENLVRRAKERNRG